jgi:fructoselysine-6-P-deglycase FrlB-like protein
MNVHKLDLPSSASTTEEEIKSQPAVWGEYAAELARHSADIHEWIRQRAPQEIWLCGAGTSAYIGETACAYLEARTGIRHRAIATTNVVSSPQDFIVTDRRVLVVSFGRSGNSSETTGVLDILDRHMPAADRLNITCNGDSELARRKGPGEGGQKTVVLPAGAHDQGFAMTASFTTMLLTVLACLDKASPALIRASVRALAQKAAETLAALEAFVARRLSSPPERAVFLGSGALTGIARESGLKVLELTRGRVATAWESALGFRHGPKAILNDRTLVVANVSIHPHTRRYDLDLIGEIRRQFGSSQLVVVGPAGIGADIELEPVGNDAWSAVLYVLLPQLLAVRWSEALGITVDNPFEGGELNRVVSGVTLYPYDGDDDVRRH